MAVIALIIADASIYANVSARSKTCLRVTVVDLDGNPIHNAQVTVNSQTFNTDNKGLSPAIELNGLTNCYDDAIEEWKTATVTVRKEGYVTAINFNCVVYVSQTRKLTVRLYDVDASELPYTSYVESPPDEYVKELLGITGS